MRKFLTMLLLFFNLPIFATSWQQYNVKGWYDLMTWQKQGNISTMWFKDLNPGNWELINNKKVWYRITQLQADCAQRKIQIISGTDYDLKGNIISNFTLQPRTYYENGKYYKEDNWQFVVPDSIGEEKYLLMCSYR